MKLFMKRLEPDPDTSRYRVKQDSDQELYIVRYFVTIGFEKDFWEVRRTLKATLGSSVATTPLTRGMAQS